MDGNSGASAKEVQPSNKVLLSKPENDGGRLDEGKNDRDEPLWQDQS